MINTQLEQIVQLVMDAYVDVHGDEYDITPIFELEVRKALMQKYCSTQSTNTYTYTVAPGTLMGTWNTGTSSGTRPCPPTISTSKELLNG